MYLSKSHYLLQFKIQKKDDLIYNKDDLIYNKDIEYCAYKMVT